MFCENYIENYPILFDENKKSYVLMKFEICLHYFCYPEWQLDLCKIKSSNMRLFRLESHLSNSSDAIEICILNNCELLNINSGI